MTRPKPETVQVLGANDDPELLVRADTKDEARKLAQTWLDEDRKNSLWAGVWEDDDKAALVARPTRDGYWRWIPAEADAEYTRWLRPAVGPAPGAFHAWRVEVWSVSRVAEATR